MRFWSITNIIATIVFNVASAWCIFVVWRERKHAYVRSRGPLHAILSGLMNMVIVTNIFVQQIYFLEGLEFPCRANLFHSFLTVPLCFFGYFYRGLRVVILSTPVLREKVGWLLSSQGVAAFYGIGMSPTLLGIAILVRNADHFTHEHHDCYCFVHQEISFWLAYAALQVIVLGVLAKKLRDFGDKVNMEQELVSTFVIIALLVPIYLTLLAYHEWEALIVRPTIQLILVAMHSVWQLNTDRYRVGHIYAKSLELLDKTDADGVSFSRGVSSCDVCAIGKSIQQPHRKRAFWMTKLITYRGHASRSVIEVQTVDQLIEHDELWIAFGETVQKFLCGESYWFLNEVREYNEMLEKSVSASIRFDKVQSIRVKYIKQGSNFEINIEAKMRDATMKVSTLEAFVQLSAEDQGGIFATAAKETRRILGENIIPAFHKSPRFIEIMAARSPCPVKSSASKAVSGAKEEESFNLPEVPSTVA